MEVGRYAARQDSGARRSRKRTMALRVVTVWKRPQERRLALALLVAAAAAVAFARVTEDYLTNDPLARWDVSFARWLSEHRSAAGVDIFRVITDVGSPGVSVAVAAAMCILLFRRRQLADAALLPVALAGAELLNLALKVSFHRARPEVSFVHLDTYSYPSGHVMVAAAAYGAFAYVLWGRVDNRRRRLSIAAAMFAIVVLISVSRLYLGVHYLSDVLGGLAAGISWLAVAIALRMLYGERFAVGFAGSRLDVLARRLTRS
jgi:undecaprenyl-diphosphatase